MKRLKHDHVLQIFGASSIPNQSFLVCALKSQGDACNFLRYNPSADRRKLVRTIFWSFVIQLSSCFLPSILSAMT